MMEKHDKISNFDLPISKVIREALHDLQSQKQNELVNELLGEMTEDEFVGHRVDIYLTEIEAAMHNGIDEMGAKEIALRECLAGLIEDNG
jgi:predicted ATPase with chaperone activity